MFGAKKKEIARLNEEVTRLNQAVTQLQGQLYYLGQFGGQEAWETGQALTLNREQAQQEKERIQRELASRAAEADATLKKSQAKLLSTQMRAKEARDRLSMLSDNDLLYSSINRLRKEEQVLKQRLSPMRARAKLEEAGLTNYEHPAEDSIALQTQLRELRKEISSKVRGYSAVSAPDELDAPETKTQRKKMAKDFARIVLRAFDAEVENIIKAATANNFEASATKIFKAAETLERLGATAHIRISPDYVELRVRELKLAVDHMAQKALEREMERERKAELREQAKVEREIEAERKRLQKEKQHYLNVLKTVEAIGDESEVQKLQDQIVAIEKGINEVEARAANIRAGYVYVISNIGSFGERMVKIGMTRRLEPMDRVKELGDASVPFGFDVHALFFSEDAVGVETELHHRFATKRVNRINKRREFFYATPVEVRDVLQEVAGNLLEFREEPEAEQYRLSLEEAQNDALDEPRAKRGAISLVLDDALDEEDSELDDDLS